MRTPTLLAAFCLIASGLQALAPHPTVLTVKYKDQMLPVLRVKGDNPCVIVEGKEKVIRSQPHYVMESASSFADNYVEAEPGTLAGPFRIRFLGSGGGPYSSMTTIEVPLTAKKTIKHPFAVVVIYANLETTKDFQEKGLGLNTKSPELQDPFLTGTTIIVYQLPELPAGKTSKTKFSGGVAPALLATDFFIQIFDDDGREVRTADVSLAWQFYAQRDRARMSVAIGKYVEKFKGTDHDAVPALMPKPIFPPEAVLPTDGVIVNLYIEADGTVSTVAIPDVKDASVRQALIDAMGGWLFLPKLKAGVPVRTKIKVPLQF